jgi:hypothetical protein
MSTAVCTLFERDYHHGLAALVNSLVRRGFGGTVYAGYRGPLPNWASKDAKTSKCSAGIRSLAVSDACRIEFVPLTTKLHFTNIKPDFMLRLFAEHPLDQLLYLDPDIVLNADWRYVVDWLSCGVALCEDVNSPIGDYHPKRIGWRRYFGHHGISLAFRTPQYVNGGCVGVRRVDLHFLESWRQLTQLMAEVIGGLDAAKIEGGRQLRQTGFGSCFDCSDQDALNAALEMSPPVQGSILPRSAMAFEHGAALLPHALGARKPWRRRYVAESLQGLPPTAADKAFWENVNGPLHSMSHSHVRASRLALAFASALGRVYRRR